MNFNLVALHVTLLVSNYNNLISSFSPIRSLNGATSNKLLQPINVQQKGYYVKPSGKTELYASVSEDKDQKTIDEEQKATASLLLSKAAEVEAALEAHEYLLDGHGIPYSELTVGVVKETYEGENRVAQSPESVKSLTLASFKVVT